LRVPGTQAWSDHEEAHAPVDQHQSDPGQAAQQDQTVGAAAGVVAGVENRHGHDQRERQHHQSQHGEGVEDRHGTAAGPACQLVDSPMGVSAPLGPLP